MEDQGGAQSKFVFCHTTVVYNIKCDLYDAGYVSFTRRHASTSCSRTQKIDSIDWQAFLQLALFGLEGSYEEFYCFKEEFEQIGLPTL